MGTRLGTSWKALYPDVSLRPHPPLTIRSQGPQRAMPWNPLGFDIKSCVKGRADGIIVTYLCCSPEEGGKEGGKGYFQG